MDEEEARMGGGDAVRALAKQDLSALSVGDLKDRIEALQIEIERCEAAIGARQDSRAAAESVFKI